MEKLTVDLNELKKKCIANGDGIYAFFYDHLSMDANRVFIVKDGKMVLPCEDALKELKLDSEWRRKDISSDNVFELLINSDSEYYGTIGFSHGMEILRKYYPGFKVYYCNVGWYTFPQCWLRVNKDTCYMRSCDEMITIIEEEDKNEDLDFVINE